MNIKPICLSAVFALSAAFCFAKDDVKIGADIPWTTYEAEKMKTTGTVLGPQYGPFLVETESSGQQCVKLTAKGQYAEFKATAAANSIVIRFSLPDSEKGEGTRTSLGIYVNGKQVQVQKINSYYSWLYGNYPFSNEPKDGKPRNFYDETRIMNIAIAKGDMIRVKRDDASGDNAEYCILDFVDLENVAAPIPAPENSVSVTDKSATGFDANENFTEALLRCLTIAVEKGKIVYIPAGTYKLTREINVPEKVTIQGAGMWHTLIVGDEKLYPDNSSNRVRFRGNGSNIHLADFALLGKLNYRDDSEPNDGIGGSFGENSTITRIWIEHTKAGIWVENSKGLVVDGCRLRNTVADGINFCVGMAESSMKNCTARGTGDDCFAMWPATWLRQTYKPGKNVITHCTAQLPFLANGAAIYGGESNKIEYCSFIDINPGSAILLSSTFPTAEPALNINNHFSGTTVVENCSVKTSGGYDHGWQWRAAVQICLDKRAISGIALNNVTIDDSFSDGLSIITVEDYGVVVELSNATFTNVKIGKYGIGAKDRHGLWIAEKSRGSVTLKDCVISETKNDSKNFAIK